MGGRGRRKVRACDCVFGENDGGNVGRGGQTNERDDNRTTALKQRR